MATLLLIAFTEAITIVVSAVMLLKMSGVLPILLACLLLLQLLLNGSIFLTSGLLDMCKRTKQSTNAKKEE